MSREQEHQFSTGEREEVGGGHFLRLLNNLEDIKNNAARESGLDGNLFWRQIEEQLQSWNLEDLYTLIVFGNKLPKEIAKRWGEKSGTLLSATIKVYHEKGGTGPLNIQSVGRKKSKWG